MLEVILLSVLAGIAITLVVQYLVFQRWFSTLPVVGPPYKDQHQKYNLPQELLDIIKDPELLKQKETFYSLNLVFQFLFGELKDTKRVRSWVMKRMNIEFAELLQTTTGKLLDTIVTREFNLGKTFPIIKSAKVENVEVKDNGLEEVVLLLDLTYTGGFQLAVDVDMVFGKSAFLSVMITKLEGTARLQFTRIPYTHWSFSFIEEPIVEFDVESQFEGRPVPQITSLIINQIRRSIRKKHTLPAYKIRYKPFFIKPEPQVPSADIFYDGKKVSQGHMQITVVGCHRLVKLPPDCQLYCTLAVDCLPWVELMSSRRKLWVTHDVDIYKVPGQNVGLTFKEEFVIDRYEELVLVDCITPYTPAHKSDVKKNDVLVAVGGVKVSSSKHAVKLIKQSTSDRLTLRIERSSSLRGLAPNTSSLASVAPDFRVEEEAVSIKNHHESSPPRVPPPRPPPRSSPPQVPPQAVPSPVDDDITELPKEEEEYINITITQVAKPNAPLSSKTASADQLTRMQYADRAAVGAEGGAERGAELHRDKSGSLGSLPDTTAAGIAAAAGTRKSSFDILGRSTGLFQRKNRVVSKAGGETSGRKSPSSSPEAVRKFTPPKMDKEDQSQAENVKVTLELSNSPLKKVESNGTSSSAESTRSDTRSDTRPDTRPDTGNNTSSSYIYQSGPTQAKQTAPTAPTTAPVIDTDDNEEDTFDLRKTQMVKASTDPQFNECFDFNVEGEQNFLNICVWARTPEKLDKQNRILKPEKDSLVGHVSLSLMDVALDCLSTLQGDSRLTVHLTPAELKAGASRIKFAQLASHPGFDERLCYGDITLHFLHSSQPLSKLERSHIQKIREENEAEAEKKKLEAQYMEQNRQRALEAGKHDFVNKHFQTATYCNFCHKKIWLKAAFQCSVCELVCHKKCTEKCQAQTICCKDGYKPKEGSPTDSPMSTPKQSVTKPAEGNTASAVAGVDTAAAKTSFLNRFRREMGREKASPESSPKASRHSSPLEVPTILNRRNSASSVELTGGSDTDTAVIKTTSSGGLLRVDAGGGGAAGGAVPRTRSTTSLQDLLRQNATPTVRAAVAALDPAVVDKRHLSYLNGSDSDSSDSEDEDEMNLLKFFEEQKHSHNADELVVTAAKEMGKELFANLQPAERKDKLDATISKMQQEIDKESENRAELGRIEQELTDPKQKAIVRAKIDKSDEKIQSLALLMLHYCSGLQHCMDQQDKQRTAATTQQTLQAEEQMKETVRTDTVTTHEKSTSQNTETKSRPTESTAADSNTTAGNKRDSVQSVQSVHSGHSGQHSGQQSGHSVHGSEKPPHVSVRTSSTDSEHYHDVPRTEISDDSEIFNDCIEKAVELSEEVLLESDHVMYAVEKSDSEKKSIESGEMSAGKQAESSNPSAENSDKKEKPKRPPPPTSRLLQY